jgi:site-specific recombinase XerD
MARQHHHPKARRAYKVDVAEFIKFSGLPNHAALRMVTHAHVIAWRKDIEGCSLALATIRRKLSALSSLFDYLCERNAVLGNPMDGVERPAAMTNEGSILCVRFGYSTEICRTCPL